MVARFSMQKDHYTLIDAISMLSDKSCYLVLIGDGPLIFDLMKYANKLKIDDRTLFLGVRQDIPQLIKMSDICVLSSNWEGFGLVAVEYMAAGRPVIVSNVSGLKDVVSDAGLIFEKGNSRDLRDKIESLIYNKNLYIDITKKGQERSMHFDINKMIYDYIRVYNNAINNV